MITKATFVKLLNAIKAQMEQDDKNGDILTQLADPEFQSHKIIYTTPLIDSVLKTLAEEFELPNQKYIGDDISYFVWDLNFGKNPMAIGCITRDDGSKVSLTTPDELYDWIIEQKNYINPQEKVLK